MSESEWLRLHAVLVAMNDGDVESTNVSEEVRTLLREVVEEYERSYGGRDALLVSLRVAQIKQQKAEIARLEASLSADEVSR